MVILALQLLARRAYNVVSQIWGSVAICAQFYWIRSNRWQQNCFNHTSTKSEQIRLLAQPHIISSIVPPKMRTLPTKPRPNEIKPTDFSATEPAVPKSQRPIQDQPRQIQDQLRQTQYRSNKNCQQRGPTKRINFKIDTPNTYNFYGATQLPQRHHCNSQLEPNSTNFLRGTLSTKALQFRATEWGATQEENSSQLRQTMPSIRIDFPKINPVLSAEWSPDANQQEIRALPKMKSCAHIEYLGPQTERMAASSTTKTYQHREWLKRLDKIRFDIDEAKKMAQTGSTSPRMKRLPADTNIAVSRVHTQQGQINKSIWNPVRDSPITTAAQTQYSPNSSEVQSFCVSDQASTSCSFQLEWSQDRFLFKSQENFSNILESSGRISVQSLPTQRFPRLSDFQILKFCGSGAFAKVHLAVHKQSGFIVALKEVQKQGVAAMLNQFISQIKLQTFLNDRNIVKVYGCFDEGPKFYIIMEYMEQGSLYSLIKKDRKSLKLEFAKEKLLEVAEAVRVLQREQIIHRDIKPENIVMTHSVCKLTDFGWSAVCRDRRNTYCGTLDYISPEVIAGDGYDQSLDVWCLGVLAYQLIVGSAPFYHISKTETIRKIAKCDLKFPAGTAAQTIEFIESILVKSVELRLSIDQIVEHPFLHT